VAGGALQDQPLPPSASSDCGIPVVNAAQTAAPAELDIPAAKISAPIVDIGLANDGSMEVPPTPDVVGWYRTSARAGQPGNAVLAGHVDWGKNAAVFWGLRDLKASDPIMLRGSDGVEHRYLVQWNRVFANNDPAALNVLRGSDESLLTLITCDGVYDRSAQNYTDRRIVQAKLDD